MLKRLADTKDKKRLLENFLSLSILQGANYILPLITLPYLVRVLGPEKFGLIMFAQAFIQYFVILTDYGFNLSATREISINRDNNKKVTKIFNSVMIIKLGLLLLSFVIINVIIFLFEKFSQDWLIYNLTFGIVVGQALFPIWLFQGMEKMKYITFLNTISKLVFIVSILIFIHKASDYIYVPLINSLASIITGILAIWIAFKNFNVHFNIPSLKDLKCQLKEGWPIFITSIQTNILSSSGIFILGLFESKEIVGYYAAVEKLLKAFVSLFLPITQAIFPYISQVLKKDTKQGKKFIIKIGLFVLTVATFLSFILIVFAKDILSIIYGIAFAKFNIILQLLTIWLFLGVLNNFIGIQFLIGAGYSNFYSKAFLVAGFLTLLIYFLLIPFFSFFGVIFGMIIGELILTILMIYYIRRYKLW